MYYSFFFRQNAQSFRERTGAFRKIPIVKKHTDLGNITIDPAISLVSEIVECKLVIIFLPTGLNICFGYSKEPS